MAPATLLTDSDVPRHLRTDMNETHPRANRPTSSFFCDCAAYGLVVLASLVILVVTLRLWRADLRVPVSYCGDGVLYLSLIKGVLDNGWYLHNDFLSMPTALDFHDFPLDDSWHFAWLKAILGIYPDAAVAFNLYFFLTFPLTSLASLFVMRRLGVSRFVSIVFSLLYTSLPFHFFRGPHHFFLGAYYLVPLLVWVVLQVFPGRCAPRTGASDKRLNRWELVGALVICAATGTAGYYYAFFGCFFLLIAGAAASTVHRDFAPLALAGLFIAVTASSVVATLSPTLLYRWQHGINREAVQRSWVEGDIYGLKIAQVLLPITGHRIDRLAKQKTRYNSIAPLTNENDHAALGVVGALGFLWLLGRQLLRSPLHARPAIDDGLALCNTAGILLATIGGLGSLAGMVVTTYIRGYNRICVFLGFFALLSMALLLDRATRRWGTSWRARMGWVCALSLLLTFGVLDQTSRTMIPAYSQLTRDYRGDEAFVRRIEAAVPPGSMIFQLPYVDFVEHPPINQMISYDMLRPYLHSHSLRWSYGAMRGRPCAFWQKSVAGGPTDLLVHDLGIAGFAGIYIDRAAYRDNGDRLEHELISLLRTDPIISENGRFVFYDLAEHNRQLRDQYTPRQWEAFQQAALHPLWVDWLDGFKGLEETPAGDSWRWCGDQGEMRIHNPSECPRRVALRMTLAGTPSRLHMAGDLLSEDLGIESSGTAWERTVCVPAGVHVVRFQCDRPPLPAPSQPRNLVFRVVNFTCRETPP